jgi:peptide deformylase
MPSAVHAGQAGIQKTMALLEIVTPPNPTLRQRARKVRALNPEVQTLVDNMIETMRAASGVGLAAPQVDVGQRIIVVEYGEGAEDPDTPAQPPTLYALINPEIIRTTKETVLANEACLSLPGFFGEVERFKGTTVKGLDKNGHPVKLKTRGWLARIFQHEIDHLNGILFIDRATQVWRVEDSPEGEFLPRA